MKTYKIMLIGEAFNEDEAKEGRPFVGSNGSILSMLLRAVGLPRDEIYTTVVFQRRPGPASNDIKLLCGPKTEALPGFPPFASGKYIPATLGPELTRLYAEINSVKPNLIIAAGPAATWALIGTSGIKKIRGAPLILQGPALEACGPVKVLATYHPSSVVREWKLRPIAMADLDKAKREATFPELRRPNREFWLSPTVDDLYAFEAKFITPGCDLSIDIETANGQVTCIGFAPNPGVALVIPFVDQMQPDGNYWRTFREEMEAWRFVRRLCETHPSIGQNFAYDMNYLWTVYGIRCMQMKDDTMLMQHALQPEMEKGLGFLGSIYTNEPAWKFMRAKHETLKKED